jgi:hypothetical protein
MDSISLADVFAIQSSWDYFLYVIMFFQFILLLILFVTENLRDTIMIAVVVTCAFADKAYIFGYLEGGASTVEAAVNYHSKLSFGAFALRVAMFGIPVILITQTKVKRAKPLCILLGIMGVLYLGARWFFEQREGGWADTTPENSLNELDQMALAFTAPLVLAAKPVQRWLGKD